MRSGYRKTAHKHIIIHAYTVQAWDTRILCQQGEWEIAQKKEWNWGMEQRNGGDKKMETRTGQVNHRAICVWFSYHREENVHTPLQNTSTNAITCVFVFHRLCVCIMESHCLSHFLGCVYECFCAALFYGSIRCCHNAAQFAVRAHSQWNDVVFVSPVCTRQNT